MRKFIASVVGLLPLLAAAQEAAQPPPPQAEPPPAQQAPQYPPQYAPPPQYTPPPPQGQYVPPPQYQPQPAQAQPQPYRRPDHQRDSWYIGFGIGGGDGTIKDSAGTSSFNDFFGKSPTTLAFNFKVGATLTPRLLLGLDFSGVSSTASDSGVTATLGIANYDGVVTFFPMERGLFLRGGVGLSRLTLDVTGFGSSSFSGANVTGGAGYAWWLGRTFNLTVNLDYSAQFYGDNNGGTTGPQGSSFWALGLGFDWY